MAIDGVSPPEDAWWELGGAHRHLADGPRVDDEGLPAEDEQWVEAPFLADHAGAHYLFVNWYACCNGPESTYEIRVGRSEDLDGPYLDREGVPLLEGGGTRVIQGAGALRGPGHAGIFRYQDAEGQAREVFTFHRYPPDGKPWATLEMRALTWVEGWPVIADSPWDPADYWATLGG